MKKWTKIIIGTLIALFLVCGGGWLYLRSQVYQASRSAEVASQSAVETQSGLNFLIKHEKGPAVIFYPGALVSPASYSIWARQVAAAGYSVHIVRFPLDLAVFAPNRASQVQLKSSPDYVIGGHSLGGVMASRYARQHAQNLKGVFFLASYPDQKGRLDQTSLPVLSVTASRDGVLNQKSYRHAKQFLPAKTEFTQIKGGNHAGFGSYGRQKGDHTATISNQTQQKQIAQSLIHWLRQFN